MPATTEPPPPFVHRALLHVDDDGAGAVVAAELDAAAARGEPTFAALEPGVRRAVERRLRGNCADQVVFVERDTLTSGSVDSTIEAFLRVVDALRRDGRASTFVSHDLHPLVDDFSLRVEDGVNLAAGDRPVTSTCLYDLRIASAAQLRAARLTHPVLLVDGHERASPDFRPPAHDAGDVPQSDVDLRGLAALRGRLRGLATGLPAAVLDDFVVVVNEVVTSAVVAMGAPVRVGTGRHDGRPVCTVAVRGPLSVVDPEALAAGLPEDHVLHDLSLAVRVGRRARLRVVHTAVGGLIEVTAGG